MTFTRDELDADLKASSKVLDNMDSTKFSTLRTRIWKRVISSYMAELITGDDPFAKDDTLGLALDSDAAVLDTTVGDLYTLALPVEVSRIADDTIFVSGASGELMPIPRTDIDTIVTSGTDATALGFDEVKGKVKIYAKQSEFTAPGTLHFNFYRQLDAAPALGTTALDIKFDDYDRLLSATRTGMLANLDVV